MNSIAAYRAAIDALRDGGVVALPTDTVFGLCALARDADAVERVYAIKRRDRSQPLPVFVASVDQACLVAKWNDAAQRLADAFWPGALTIVLPCAPAFRTLASAGTDTIAVRVADHPALREIAAQLGPLTGTSANRSGQPECRTAAEVRAQLGGTVDAIVDAPVSGDAPPSTVVDCTDPARVRVLRTGAIDAAAVQRALSGAAVVI